jgi:predicted glycosyltransferase
MRIWIDLSNSPHPLLFSPIARRLEELGHSVHLTARDNAQTVELASERWPEVTVIGGASPKGRVPKARVLAARVSGLRRWARTARPDVALSHGSYGQIVAAFTLGIPTITAMDFEHQPANHLAFRLSGRVVLPTALHGYSMRHQGLTRTKAWFYPGLKEEVYLADFRPDPKILDELGVSLEADEPLVVARPAPDQAIYHSFENPLFVECVKSVLRTSRATVVVLPRHDGQRQAIERLGEPRCIVAGRAIDSRSLMSRADLMIGAGGTMTREAALMGVPTLSLFAGRRPAVDRWLEANGMMRVIRDVRDLPTTVEPQPRADRLDLLRERGRELVDTFCDAVTSSIGARG